MPDIAIAAKRYDGGTALATYTGCIPLAPGQLFETNTGLSSGTPLVAQASLRGNVSLWRASGPAEIPAYITALYPQHPDGSIKSVMVSTILTLASGVQHDMLLRVGTSPTLAASPTAHPTIDAAWMKFPFLIGCTDQQHMCDSRVAFGPLVPVDHPSLPQTWRDFLTTELENGGGGFPTYKNLLERLAAQGDLGQKVATFTPGSAVITNIQGTGWPTPSDPPTSTMTVGQVVKLLNGGASYVGNVSSGTTIASVDGPTQVTLNDPVSSSATFFGPTFRFQFEPTHPTLNATYNVIAPLYYRYMTATSGHLDKLREAQLLAVAMGHDGYDWVGKGTESAVGVINYGTGNASFAIAKYHGAYTDAAGVVHANLEPYPVDEYGQAFQPTPSGTQADRSGFHQSAWMCYLLSGWPQALGILISYAMRHFPATTGGAAFAGYPWASMAPNSGLNTFHTPTWNGGGDHARQNYRNFREGDAFGYLLSLPFSLTGNVNGQFIMPSPRLASYPYPATPPAGSNREKYLTFFQRKYWDATEQYSTEFNPVDDGTTTSNHWLYGLWGYSPYYSPLGDTKGPSPIFQHQMVFNTLLLCYTSILEDARFPTKMGEWADWIANTQNAGVLGTFTSAYPPAVARPVNAPMYQLPYRVLNPAYMGDLAYVQAFSSGVAFWSANIILAMLIYGYRVTGNPKLLAMADAHATIYSQSVNVTIASGGPVGNSTKTIGETFHMAHYAAAWRAGATWGVGLAQIAEPVITNTPYHAGDVLVSGTGVAGGTVTLSRNATTLSPQPIDGTGHWAVAVAALVAGDVLAATQSNGTLTSGPSQPTTVLPAVLPDPPVFTGTPYHAGDVTVSGTGVVAATVTLTINGITAGSAVVSGSGVWTKPVSALVAGDTLTATQTTGSGTSAASSPTTVLSLPPVDPPPVTGEGNFLLLETAANTGFMLLETGDVLLLETGDKVLLDLAGDRLLTEFTTSAASRMLLETGDTLLLETGDDLLLEGAGYEGTTVTGGLLLEGVGATPSASHTRRTYGRARTGVRGWGG